VHTSNYKKRIDDVKGKTSITRLVEDLGVELFGNKGLCPFHNDHDPSFVVYEYDGRWICMGCNRRGGDVIDFVKVKLGLEFWDAVGYLEDNLDRYKKSSSYQGPPARVISTKKGEAAIKCEIEVPEEEKRIVSEILDLSVNCYHSILMDHPEILKYLLKSDPFPLHEFDGKQKKWVLKEFTPYGFDLETIKKFRIGFAPEKSSCIRNIMYERGFSKEDLALSGLYVFGKDRSLRSFYRNRLVFPYLGLNREVLYTIARRTEWTPMTDYETGKYKKHLTKSFNRPYVSASIQNNHIFMAHMAKTSSSIVITEGITDCIAANANGIPCISPVTTRFSYRDLDQLASLCVNKTVFICNDSEDSESGLKGAKDTLEYLEGKGVKAYIVHLPRPNGVEKIDLCEYLRFHTVSDFKKLLPISGDF
jgi:DNA primase